MKKIIKILSSLLIFTYISTTFAGTDLSIISIEAKNMNKISIFLDKEITSQDKKINNDLKIFRDYKDLTITKDLQNDKLIKISLQDPLETNSSYSLLAIYGVEGNIDFKIEDVINGLEIKAENNDKIEKVKIIDSKNIEVYFKNSITSDEIDIKLLKDINLDLVLLNENNNKEIDIFTKENLEAQKDYLAMLFSIETKEGQKYEISNSIYEFQTAEKLEGKTTKPQEIEENKKVEKVALNSAETPDTGPETWILVLLTFIISSFVYLRKAIK